VNLIGEHTDYHQGLVLPTVIPQRTRVVVTRRNDATVRARSDRMSGGTLQYELGRERRSSGWLDYVQGVTFALRAAGLAIAGFEAQIESDVPVGAGLSSSAALEVSLVRGLRALFDLDLDDRRVAQLAHDAETGFVGAPVGIMDQMVASLGRDHEALFIDTRTGSATPLPLPASIDLIVIHSGSVHQHASGEYAVRRAESFHAATALGLDWLRDADRAWLPRIQTLPPVLARRARHVVTENDRVRAAVLALGAGDAEALGALFTASHVSMRDDYEITTPAIDALVGIGRAHPDVYGARMTGGGFGGAVVMIAKTGRARDAAAAIASRYQAETGIRSEVLMPASA
jgi:galactokinase